MNSLAGLLLITPKTQDKFYGKRTIEQELLPDHSALVKAVIDQEPIEPQH